MGYRQVYGWLSGAVATAAILCPAIVQASELADWSFDETSQQLEFALPETVIPQFFMLAEPARIVLDIPNTQIGNIPTDQTYTGSIERIRVSQYDAATVRIVMDLAPGTVLDPQQADIQFDDVNGRRQWRFRPLISGVEIAVTAPDSLLTSPPPSPQPTAAALPQTTTPVPDADLAPEDDNAIISFSAASLVSDTASISAASRDLPIEVYEAVPNSERVAVPPVASTPGAGLPPTVPVQVPPLATTASSSSAPASVEVPPMAAPELNYDEPLTASEPITPDIPALPTAETAVEPDLPTLDTLPTTSPTVEDNPVASGEPDGASADVAVVPTPSTPIGILTRPNFVEPDAASSGEPAGEIDLPTAPTATSDTVTATRTPQAPPTPAEGIPVTAAVAGDTTPESSPRNPGQQVAEAAANTPAQAQVIQLPAQDRTITQTRWPDLIQFGQPLPND